MRSPVKTLINTDPEQARQSREWQAKKDAKREERRKRRLSRRDQQSVFDKQRAEALDAGLVVKKLKPGPAHHSTPSKPNLSHQLAVALETIARLEGIIRTIRGRDESNFYESKEWHAARYQALKRSNGQCELCGDSKADGARLQVDHIKPRSKFPELELDQSNLQVLCRPCNMGKSNRDATDWRRVNLKVVRGD